MYRNYFAMAAIAAVVGIFLFLRARRASRPMISLVFLLKEPRRFSERIARESAGKALDVVFDPTNPDAADFVTTLPALEYKNIREADVQRYLLKIDQGAFMINSIALPYVDDPEKFAADVADQRLRHVIASHCGWISVDVMGDPPTGKAKDDAYRTIGKVMAALGDDDCLAIYCPELQRCNEYNESLLDILRSDDPLALFEVPTFAPIIQVHGDDPRIAAAVQEARERWPEFVSAFATKTEHGMPFLVKAEFQQDDTSEYMWVSVTGIDQNIVHGILENTPGRLTNFKEGQKVAVDISLLNDWLYVKDEEGIGGFSMKVISENMQSA